MSSKERPWLTSLFVAVACLAGLAVLGGILPGPLPFAVHEALAAPQQPPPAGPPTTGEAGEEPGKKRDDQGKKGRKDDKLNASPGPRKLTNEEISRLRYLELRGMRLKANDRPDRVIVKIPPDVVNDFLSEMEGDPNFRGDEARREFHKLTPPQKLHLIAYWKGAKYADRVQVLSDPEVFVSFKKNVMPQVLRGCAKAGCHTYANDDEKMRLRLFNDPKRSPATTFTNFVMLNEIKVGNNLLIDRAHPEDSLLLTCMLPSKDVNIGLRHPGGIELTPLFRTTKSNGYRQILKWISMLKHPAENYRVHLLAEPGDPTTAPDDAEHPGDLDKPVDEGGRPAQPPELPKGPPTSRPNEPGLGGDRGPAAQP